MTDTPIETPWYQTIPMPALLRHARTTYGAAMRRALAKAGYDDVPRNGLYVIGGMAMGEDGTPLSQLIRELGISKQAAGQLVDTLVMRGYLERSVDEEDRRKLTVSLTPRGRDAALAQTDARKAIDAALISSAGAETVLAARRALAVLCKIGREAREEGASSWPNRAATRSQ